MDSTWIHRLEIIVIDLVHFVTIIILGLFCISLLVWGGTTGEFLVPWLTPAVAGLVSRLDALVHRKGRWLRDNGDGWEIWKQQHKEFATIVAWSDVIMGLIILVSLIYAQYLVVSSFEWPTMRKFLYVQVTSILNGIAVWNVIRMSKRISDDYDQATPTR